MINVSSAELTKRVVKGIIKKIWQPVHFCSLVIVFALTLHILDSL